MREYIRNNKWTLLITSGVILLPVLGGILLWDRLPQQLPTHWGANGEVDGWTSKTFAVLGIPALMLVLQYVCFFASAFDPKRRNIRGKMLGLALWIIPVLNLFLHVMIYLTALERDIQITVMMPLFMGALWVIVGNYLPKCQQSYTLGIKLPWTLADEETWNVNHRMAGKLWVAGGLATMLCALLPTGVAIFVLLGILLSMVLIPTVYAYRFYRKKQTRS